VVEKARKIEKHVRLMEGFEEFKMDDLINEILSTEWTTKLLHLLDLFPKFRTTFNQKLELTSTPVTNTITNVITAISNHKIVKVKGTVENIENEIFLDSCASMNMVSRSLLNKIDSKELIGNITETIFQAYSIATNSTDIYKLKLKNGTYEFERKL